MYWFYAGICACNLIFGIFVLPETKGKHLEDINKDFQTKKILVEKKSESLNES